MTVSGRGKLTNANYVGNRHNCWSGFIIDCFVDKWILVCLELCRHGVLSGPWYLWNHAEMRFASHAVALPELCGPLPYVQGSLSLFFFFLSHVLYLELSLLVLWWLVILPERLKCSDWQIYSKNYDTWNKRATVSKTNVCS